MTKKLLKKEVELYKYAKIIRRYLAQVLRERDLLETQVRELKRDLYSKQGAK